ncbi:MAG: 30S ribosomal protein S3 [Euryarchaeota archaeon]|jgi:small subunit ribosomal protein S3|nr:30S ribosomal protein S3 [Euryarchaeota archaeon]MBT7937990.1 30S ribosomal protein S3 [Euryarchaeota archaeon]
MARQNNVIRRIIDRNVERHLVKEFLMNNTKRAGFGGLVIRRTPQGTEVTLKAERPGMVIGRKGRIINELQRRLEVEFKLQNPRLKVDEVEKPALNAQIMAEKLASALERGWYFRRAGHSTALNIMEAGAKGVIVILNGKITGARHRTQKFIAGHVKYCGETALVHMDRGFSTAIKKLGTIGCSVAIMRPGTKLPHEITVYGKDQVSVNDEGEIEVIHMAVGA